MQIRLNRKKADDEFDQIKSEKSEKVKINTTFDSSIYSQVLQSQRNFSTKAKTVISEKLGDFWPDLKILFNEDKIISKKIFNIIKSIEKIKRPNTKEDIRKYRKTKNLTIQEFTKRTTINNDLELSCDKSIFEDNKNDKKNY